MSVWQASISELDSKGATLMAIAPQSPEVCARFRSQHGLSFEVLSDPDHAVLDLYRLGFELPDPLQELFCSIGLDLAEIGGGGHWVVPTPATMLVGQDRRIGYVDINADFRRRLEPRTILDLL